MAGATKILRRSRLTVENLELRRLLLSEINHELKSELTSLAVNQKGSLGDFTVEWDSTESKDVVLRRFCDSGEEVAVSALLGHSRHDHLLKVCVKKPGLSSVLQFDCRFYPDHGALPWFDINNVSFLPSIACPKSSTYRGPFFRTLDPYLQVELKEYLVAKGISVSLIDFLLQHLAKKEQGQYVRWLQKLETLITEGE
ncbi:Mitochondrial glycoprotein family protein [Euphorbia peplus]|nr:Mitochondrial glycoprotein family protein [Euphorbia peplus]